jgi:hypothetical protein
VDHLPYAGTRLSYAAELNWRYDELRVRGACEALNMQCNIDQRGRRVRMIWGVMLLVIAAGLVAATALGWIAFGWGVGLSIAAAAFGGFAIFESRRSWCALRAMGFRTPM